MRKIVLFLCLALTMSIVQRALQAQENQATAETAKAPEKPIHYYRLDFVVQEVNADRKPTNSRAYTATISTDTHETWGPTSIRTGSRIPVPSGTNQWQYIDIGVNIDARNAREVGHELAMHINTDISSLATPLGASQPNALPVIRQNKWQADVLVPVGKPTVVFTSDVLDTSGTTQLTVTATPLS